MRRRLRAPVAAAGLAVLGLLLPTLPAQAAPAATHWTPYCATSGSVDDGGTDMWLRFRNPNDSNEYATASFQSYGEVLDFDGSRLTRLSEVSLTWWTSSSDPTTWRYSPLDGNYGSHDFSIPEGADVIIEIGVQNAGVGSCRGVA